MVATEKIKAAVEALKSAKKVTALTGAGVSKESGIPTFREAQTGLWAKYDPETLATPEGFLKDPALVWSWYDYRRQLVCRVEPNAGHIALAHLQDILPLAVVTQNVDGLHARAGSKEIIELHGNISRFVCFDKQHAADNVPIGLAQPPDCTICGAMLRPAVVWFGESLPPRALEQASALMQACDVVLVIGTSGLVHPAAGLPYLAKRSGAIVIEINPNATPLTDIADIHLGDCSASVLPALLAGLVRS